MIEGLRAEGVVRSFGPAFTLQLDRLHLGPGQHLAIAGPSGCGKSTLLAVLALALRPTAGAVLALNGTDALPLWHANDNDGLAALRARHLGYVPQTGALLQYLTLADNIALPQRILGRPDPALIAHLAERLGIAAQLHRLPAQVSVGQRQRAAVARALAHRPAILLADEPTASVHPAQADEILALLRAAATEQGAALVISTHDTARATAAGFPIAPCRPEPGAATTRFAWP